MQEQTQVKTFLEVEMAALAAELKRIDDLRAPVALKYEHTKELLEMAERAKEFALKSRSAVFNETSVSVRNRCRNTPIRNPLTRAVLKLVNENPDTEYTREDLANIIFNNEPGQFKTRKDVYTALLSPINQLNWRHKILTVVGTTQSSGKNLSVYRRNTEIPTIDTRNLAHEIRRIFNDNPQTPYSRKSIAQEITKRFPEEFKYENETYSKIKSTLDMLIRNKYVIRVSSARLPVSGYCVALYKKRS